MCADVFFPPLCLLLISSHSSATDSLLYTAASAMQNHVNHADDTARTLVNVYFRRTGQVMVEVFGHGPQRPLR